MEKEITLKDVIKDIEDLKNQNKFYFENAKEVNRLINNLETEIKNARNFNNSINYKIKYDYEKLKRIILDENISITLKEEIKNNLKYTNEKLSKKLDNAEFENYKNNNENDKKSINEQLEHITNKAKIIVTPEMFGAKGDNISDDYIPLLNMFNYKDNVVINFPKNKTYRVSRGILIKKSGLTVYGNNSTIKFTDNCSVLQEIYNGTSTTVESTLLYFDNYDNIAFYNLNLDGNADNVTFTHNEQTYYGYQQDIGIEGMPSRYICTFGIHGSGCNNIILENCSIKHIGAPVTLGGVWGSNDIKKNIVIKNVEIEDCFRDGIVLSDCEDFIIENAKITNGQRKGIQCYRNVHNGKIINPIIINDENQIRKWYPTWSLVNTDAELIGIGIQNPGYTDVCTNIEIINPYIDVYKIGLTIRNYSENITVNRGYIKSRNGSSFNHSGVIDLILRDLTFVGLTCIANDYNATHSNVNKTSSINIIENVILQGNVGLYYKVYDTCSLESINVLANNLTLNVTTKVNVASTTKSNIINITSNSLPNQTLNGANIINPYEFLNIKNTYTTKIAYKSNTNKEYIKFFTFKINKLNKCMAINGTLNKLSGNNVSCFDFKTMIRSNWESLSNGITTEIRLLNAIATSKTGVGYLTLYDDATDSITVDFYFISSSTGTYMIDFQINDYEKAYDYEFMANSSGWVTDLSMTKEALNT